MRLGEARWPPVTAVLIFLALNIGLRLWLPTEGAIRTPWLLPAIETALLVVLLADDPQGVARRMKTLRRLALTLVFLLLAAALWATAFLVYDLIKGTTGVTNSPSQLLASGALVWLGNNSASPTPPRSAPPTCATHPSREVHDARAVDHRARALRPDRRPCCQRLRIGAAEDRQRFLSSCDVAEPATATRPWLSSGWRCDCALPLTTAAQW